MKAFFLLLASYFLVIGWVYINAPSCNSEGKSIRVGDMLVAGCNERVYHKEVQR